MVVVFILRKCNIKKVADILQRREILLLLSTVTALIVLVLFLLVYREKRGFDFFYYIMFVMCAILIAISVIDNSVAYNKCLALVIRRCDTYCIKLI